MFIACHEISLESSIDTSSGMNLAHEYLFLEIAG